MAAGDETQADPRPSFPHSGGADETVVNKVVPPPRPAHRPAVDPGPAGDDPYAGANGGFRGPGGRGFDPGPSLFDAPAPDRDARRTVAPSPRILANQASDWESNLQEIEVVRSRRTGLILLFLLALLVVAVIALGLAAWSVIGGRGQGEGDVEATATTVPDGSVAGAVDSTISEPTTTTIDPNALRVTIGEDPFLCDGGTREFALIAGAQPNEEISFTSPQSQGLRNGTADANGELPLRWQCDPTQVGTTWELTATGLTSGKAVTFLFAGAAAPADAAPAALMVDVMEDPFACDGVARIFAGLSGAEPNEEIAFSSPQSPGLRTGQADADGTLPVRWVCDPSQAGTTWELTATGVTSGRTVTFSFTGS